MAYFNLNSTIHPSLITNTNTSSSTDNHTIFTLKILPSLYMCLFFAGISLNSAAAFIFFRVPSDSALVVYLKNMMVADLLMLCTFPFRLFVHVGTGGESWRVHVLMCRYTLPVYYSSMYVGIVFIGCISVERYLKIVRQSASVSASSAKSCRCVFQSVCFARCVCVCVWSVLLVCVLPNVILTSQPATRRNARKCMELKTSLGVQWHKASSHFCVSLFWFTLMVIVFCYTSIAFRVYKSYRRVQNNNSKNHVCRKSNRSILSILVVFFVCFVPYHLIRIPYTLSQMQKQNNNHNNNNTHSHLHSQINLKFSPETSFVLFQMKEATLFLAALNVCLDPVVYFMMCRTFRESLKRKLSSGRERRRSVTGTENTA